MVKRLPIEDAKVGHAIYDVQPWSAEEADTAALDGGIALGESDHDGCVIKIRTDLPPEIVAEVMVHELLHSIFTVFGVPAGSNEAEEKIVLALGRGLTTVFADNPRLCPPALKTLLRRPTLGQCQPRQRRR